MKLKIENLLSLEDYDNQREDIKKDLMEHKKYRTVSIGEHIILLFENYSTIKYQVQEMLRIEKIFNKKEIQEEICLLYTSPSPRDATLSRMPSSA